ncbi:MAG: P-II family nitrogen regulator [Candidatus Binataceae bacterium]
MKKIEVVISSEAADAVIELLDRRDISNFSLFSIMAKDSRGAHIQTYRGHAYAVALSPEVKVEAVVPDSQATATAYAILDSAREAGGSFTPRVIITPVTEVILELGGVTPKSCGESGPRRDRIEEQLRPDASAAGTVSAANTPAPPWAAPLHLVHRITIVVISHLRRLRTSAGTTRTSTPFSESTRRLYPSYSATKFSQSATTPPLTRG